MDLTNTFGQKNDFGFYNKLAVTLNVLIDYSNLRTISYYFRENIFFWLSILAPFRTSNHPQRGSKFNQFILFGFGMLNYFDYLSAYTIHAFWPILIIHNSNNNVPANEPELQNNKEKNSLKNRQDKTVPTSSKMNNGREQSLTTTTTKILLNVNNP